MTASPPAGTPRPATTDGDATYAAEFAAWSEWLNTGGYEQITTNRTQSAAGIAWHGAWLASQGRYAPALDVCARLVAWADGDRDAATLRALVDDARAAVQAADGSA